MEATLLAVFVAACVTLMYGARRLLRIKSRLPDSAGSGPAKRAKVIPFFVLSIVCLFLFSTLLSWFFSVTRNYGLDEVLRDTALGLLFLWAARIGLDGTQGTLFDRFVRFIAYGAIAAATIGVFVYAFQPVNRFVGTFFYVYSHADYWPNAWAEFVLLSWPFVLIAYFKEQRVAARRILLCGLTLLLTSLLLSYSRGGVLVFCIQLLLLGGFIIFFMMNDVRFRRSLRTRRTQMIVRLLAIVASVFLLALSINLFRASFYPVQSVQEKITFTASEGTSSVYERIEFWKQAFSLSLDHPMLGYGPYSFRFVQPRFAQGVLQTSDHPHNVVLKLAMERGWPAAIFFLLLITTILVQSLRSLRDGTTVLLLISVLGVFLHNLIDYNLQFVAISLPLWLTLGFLVVAVPSEQSIATSFAQWKRAQYLFWLQIAVSVVLLCVFLFESSSLVMTALARASEWRGKGVQALSWYKYTDHVLLSRDILLKEADLLLALNKIPEAGVRLAKYKEKNAEDYRFWKVQAILQLRQGDVVASKYSLTRAFEIAKYMDLDILHLLLSTAKTDQDRQELLAGKMIYDTVFSDFSDAILHNTHYVALSQNPEYLMSVARDLGQLFPTDARRYTLIARKAYTEATQAREKAASRLHGMLW